MHPTIKDVAKKANVSVATVSRVLNNLPGYSDKTKQKVLQVIAEMGYQPNAVARGLVNKRTQTIGVLFPNVSSMFTSEVLHGVELAAHARNQSVIVCNTDEDGKRTMKYLQVLREKQVDGIIFTSEVLQQDYYEAIEAMNIPLVLLSSMSNQFPVPYVKVDDYQAAYDAVTFLIEKGHRQIGMISGSAADPIAGRPRIEGYKQALQQAGIPFNKNYMAFGNFGFESGRQAMQRLLDAAPDITAIFASSDEMAVGALTVAYQRGIQVPDQLSIIGYDNLQIAEMATPSLTTVAQPLFEMGKQAADMLLDMIDTGEPVASRTLSHRIIERQTVSDLL